MAGQGLSRKCGHGGAGHGGAGRGGEPGVGSVAAPPRLLDQPGPPAPPQPQGPADAAKACVAGRKVKTWGRAGGAGQGLQPVMLGSRRGEEPRCSATRGQASAGPMGLRPFAAGPNRDAWAAPLRVLGARRARCTDRVRLSQPSPDLRPG